MDDETKNISKKLSQNNNNEEIDGDVIDNDIFMDRDYYQENQQGYYYLQNMSQGNLSQQVPPPAVSPPQENINFSLSTGSDFNNTMSVDHGEYLSYDGKEQINTIAVQNDANNSESISTVTEDKSFNCNVCVCFYGNNLTVKIVEKLEKIFLQ